MSSRPVTIITPDSGVPETLRASGIALAERVSRLEADRTLFDNQISKLGTVELSEETLKAVDSSRSNRILMWQMELQLRIDYDAWLIEYHDAVGDLIDRAIQDRQVAENVLVASLVKLGYSHGEGSEFSPERITQEMLLKHPSVRSVRLRLSDLEAVQISIDMVKDVNDKARTATNAKMAEYRSRLLAGV